MAFAAGSRELNPSVSELHYGDVHSGSREKPRAVKSSRPARRAKPESDEPRVAKRRRWRRRWPFRWRLGCRCDGHTLRQRYRARCHLRWQDHGRMEFRSGQPERVLDRTRIRGGSELDQFRPHDAQSGPGSFSDPTAVPDAGPPPDRRKTPVFRAIGLPQLRRARAAIIPHLLRNCGSLRPKSLTRLRASRVALRCVAGVVYVEPFCEIRPGAPCRGRGRRRLAADGSPGPGLGNSSGSRHAGDPGRRGGCLSAPQGATPSGSHWYYRIDRVTKRQCWYLREESDTGDDKFARAAPPASAPASAAEEPAPPQQRTITRKSIADARAEWVSQQPAPSQIRQPESSERLRRPPPRRGAE